MGLLGNLWAGEIQEQLVHARMRKAPSSDPPGFESTSVPSDSGAACLGSSKRANLHLMVMLPTFRRPQVVGVLLSDELRNWIPGLSRLSGKFAQNHWSAVVILTTRSPRPPWFFLNK